MTSRSACQFTAHCPAQSVLTFHEDAQPTKRPKHSIISALLHIPTYRSAGSIKLTTCPAAHPMQQAAGMAHIVPATSAKTNIIPSSHATPCIPGDAQQTLNPRAPAGALPLPHLTQHTLHSGHTRVPAAAVCHAPHLKLKGWMLAGIPARAAADTPGRVDPGGWGAGTIGMMGLM
jgi:hypothetical protein